MLTIVFLSIIFLILTPWLKTGILFALISLSAYLYFSGIDSWLPIIFLVTGIILITFEIFIPGFGLLGFLGIGSTVFGLYFTTGDIIKTVTDLGIALATSAVLIVILIRSGYSFSNWNQFVLNAKSVTTERTQTSVESAGQTEITVGMEGEATTPLRPSGKVVFDDNQLSYDVLSADGHIGKGTRIVIQEIHGTKIIVRKI